MALIRDMIDEETLARLYQLKLELGGSRRKVSKRAKAK